MDPEYKCKYLLIVAMCEHKLILSTHVTVNGITVAGNKPLCDLLWRNWEQVTNDIWPISDLVQTNSLGYYGQG